MSGILVARGVMGRLLGTPARIATSLLLGGLMVLAGTAANLSGEADRVVAEIVPGGLLLIVVPLVALVFAVGALGDPYDDDTLVHLWLKPIPRWHLAAAAVLATWQWVVPLVGVIAVAISVGGGQLELLVPSVVACCLAAMAYSAVFVGLGLRTTRSLLSGLVFILIWEGFLAALSDGIASLTVRRWSSALFADLGAVRSPLDRASWQSSTVVLVLVVAVGVALTTRWLQTRDVP